MKERLIGKKSIIFIPTGFITLEILIAFSVVIISISAVMLVAFGNQSASINSERYIRALSNARVTLDDSRANSTVDFNLLNPSHITETIDGLVYTKNLNVEMINYWTKKVTSSISWQNLYGQNANVELSTLITNLNQENICNSVLSNSEAWKNPSYVSWSLSDMGVSGNNGLGFVISDIHIHSKNSSDLKMYIVMSQTPNASKDTFFIFQLDPNDLTIAPQFLGSADNAPTIGGQVGAVAIYGDYAFITNSYAGSSASCTESANCAQLQVVDIHNPSNPTVVKNVKISSTTSGGNLASGSSIFYHDGYIYIGLAKASGSGPEFNIFDVSNPLLPQLKGGYVVGSGINSISVKGSYAYIATTNNENMTILDIHDPTNPHRIGGWTPPVGARPENNGVGSNHGKSVYTVGSNVYLGRTYGTKEFYIFDATNPSNIIVNGSQDIGAGNKTSINGIAVRDYIAFLVTSTQFQVWNIANKVTPTPWTVDGTTHNFLALTTLGGSGTSLYCVGDNFYVALAGGGATSNKDMVAVITPHNE